MTKSLIKKLKEVKNKSDHQEHRHSAVLLLKGKPISWGYNSKKSDPKILPFSTFKLTHAEFDAVFSCINKSLLPRCTMLVYREDKMGNIANSRPCEMCQKMLRSFGIKNIIYSTAQGFIKEKLSTL